MACPYFSREGGQCSASTSGEQVLQGGTGPLLHVPPPQSPGAPPPWLPSSTTKSASTVWNCSVPGLAGCSRGCPAGLDTMGARAVFPSGRCAGSSRGRPAPQTTASTPAATAVRTAVGKLPGGHHGIDGHHPGPSGQLLGSADHLACQGPQIGSVGIGVKIRLLKAA